MRTLQEKKQIIIEFTKDDKVFVGGNVAGEDMISAYFAFTAMVISFLKNQQDIKRLASKAAKAALATVTSAKKSKHSMN